MFRNTLPAERLSFRGLAKRGAVLCTATFGLARGWGQLEWRQTCLFLQSPSWCAGQATSTKIYSPSFSAGLGFGFWAASLIKNRNRQRFIYSHIQGAYPL